MKFIKNFNDFDKINESNNKLNSSFINEALKSYLATALWTHEELDGKFDWSDFSKNDSAKAKADIRAFLKQVHQSGLLDSMRAEQFGHDFWLTRNGHGAGFWDRGLGDVGDRLTDIAKGFGMVDLYEGDDEKPHF